MNTILNNGLRDKFNVNIADYSYTYTWYRLTNRNLPTFLLEYALNTKSIEIIELILDLNFDVNLPNTGGDPFFFYGFQNEFLSIKEKFLQKANYEMKNWKGQNVLFHILFSYLKNINTQTTVYAEILINDFKNILSHNICLIVARDQDGCTLVETIMSLKPDQYANCALFLELINEFIMNKLFEEENLNLFMEFIYNGYSLIMLNTNFCMEDNAEQIDVFDLIKKNCDENFKNCFELFLDSNFAIILNNFYKLLKAGDLGKLKSVINDNLLLFNDYCGRSCLHIAVLYNHFGVVK